MFAIYIIQKNVSKYDQCYKFYVNDLVNIGFHKISFITNHDKLTSQRLSLSM